MNERELKTIVNRLRRIEGQIRGLEKMVTQQAPCLDILTQVSAVTAAVKKTGTEVVRIYLDQCLAATTDLPPEERQRKKTEFQRALARYIDMA